MKAKTHTMPKRVRFAGKLWEPYNWSYLSPNQLAYYIKRYDKDMSVKTRYVLATEVEIVEQ